MIHTRMEYFRKVFLVVFGSCKTITMGKQGLHLQPSSTFRPLLCNRTRQKTMRPIYIISSLLPLATLALERGRVVSDNELYTRRRRTEKTNKRNTYAPIEFPSISPGTQASNIPAVLSNSNTAVLDAGRADTMTPGDTNTLSFAPISDNRISPPNPALVSYPITSGPPPTPALVFYPITSGPSVTVAVSSSISPTAGGTDSLIGTEGPTSTAPVGVSDAPTFSLYSPLFFATRQRISSFVLDVPVLLDVHSYQHHALQKTIRNENIEILSDAKAGDLRSWVYYNGWESNTTDPCDGWFGIKCVDGTVTEIRLQRNNLTGSLPPEVSLLASDGPRATGAGKLNRLDLFNNEFLSNNLDDSWIQYLGNNMQYLNYGSTAFAGTIPMLPNHIIEYDCSFTLYEGPIREEAFAGLDKLSLLILDGNNYSSPVPSIFDTLPALKFFYIREASLVGDLSFMRGMPSIIELLIDLNPNLSGMLPSFLGELSTLKSFSVSDCGLTGTLPRELANVTGMVQLWFHGNKISGEIPSEYGNLKDLKILSLEDTTVTGIMPIDLCLNQLEGNLTSLAADCDDEVDCKGFFPECCTCCGRVGCGT